MAINKAGQALRAEHKGRELCASVQKVLRHGGVLEILTQLGVNAAASASLTDANRCSGRSSTQRREMRPVHVGLARHLHWRAGARLSWRGLQQEWRRTS